MKTARLRHIRHERSEFDARFYERHRAFSPIARAAQTFASSSSSSSSSNSDDAWPEVRDYAKAFEGEPVVRFEPAPLKRKRPAGLIARDELYDAVIVKRRTVPTRARMWHDFLNALVWTTFPRSKLALHQRQHEAIERWIPEGATQLPNARTRELDALALVDEGGVLVLSTQPAAAAAEPARRESTEYVPCEGETGRARAGGRRQPARANEKSAHMMLFGHALFEGLVFDQPAMTARLVVLDARGHEWTTEAEAVRLADVLLSELLGDRSRVVSPDELPRLPLSVLGS